MKSGKLKIMLDRKAAEERKLAQLSVQKYAKCYLLY